MAVIALAGLDPWPVLRSRDHTFVMAAMAVARRAIELAREVEERQQENLAVRIGNAVGRALGG